MTPGNKTNKPNKNNATKGNQPKGGTGNKNGRNKPAVGGMGKANTAVVSTPVSVKPIPPKTDTTQPDSVSKFPPLGIQFTDFRKWCVKAASVLQPVIEKRSFDTKALISTSKDEDSYPLGANTVVNVLKQRTADPPSWSAVTFEKTLYDRALKDWVTTKVTGWVEDVYLDNFYVHKNKQFEKPVVKIDNPTKNSTDAQQYMTIEDENFDEFKPRYNMCGELSIAFVAKEDIVSVLKEWKAKSPGVYNKMVGKDHDKPLERSDMEDILKVQSVGFERYVTVIEQKGKPLRVEKIPLADGNDPRRASDEMQKKLEGFYFITNLKINTLTGDLIPAHSVSERNHWVVVDKITYDGNRVELYNPFPNKFQEYSFSEFYQSVHGDPNSGWWIKRSAGQTGSRGNVRTRTEETPKVKTPEFKVHLEVPKRDTDTAEQYVWIAGKKKTQLCGEFCAAYIVSDSMDNALKHWSERQKAEPAGLWELSTILKSYGYQNGAPKPFSIITALEYWKVTQPKLYEYHVGNNKPTGSWELSTILKAYGYTNVGDLIGYRTGLTDESTKQILPSPGRIKAKLKTHYLIAGVGIHKLSGKLISGDAVRHWVVLENITPVGGLVGGNGGWVELYNPFTNIMEEYSLKELANSMSEAGLWGGDGLWVTRDVKPKFKEQPAEEPRPEVKVTRVRTKSGGKNQDKQRGKGGKGNKNQGKQGGKGEGGKDGKNKGKQGGKGEGGKGGKHQGKQAGKGAGNKDTKNGGKNHGR